MKLGVGIFLEFQYIPVKYKFIKGILLCPVTFETWSYIRLDKFSSVENKLDNLYDKYFPWSLLPIPEYHQHLANITVTFVSDKFKH